MRQLTALAGLVALAALVAACGAPPTPVAYADVCNQPDGSVVQTEGYFAVDGSIFCSNTGSSELECGFEFVDTPDSSDGFTADVGEGSGRNKVEPIPDDFTPESILIHADDGSDVRLGDKVTISGKLLIAENVCLMNVSTISRAP